MILNLVLFYCNILSFLFRKLLKYRGLKLRSLPKHLFLAPPDPWATFRPHPVDSTGLASGHWIPEPGSVKMGSARKSLAVLYGESDRA